MSSWTLIEELLATLQKTAAFPSEILPVIAEQLEDAICSPRKDSIDQLSKNLAALWERLVKLAPEDAMNGALKPTLSSERAAFMLGQIGFAQLLASQTTLRRADDSFFEDLRSPAFQSYITALNQGELTGKELALKVGEADETVSRKLRRLRELGISDYRSKGVKRLNFLTPQAKALCAKDSNVKLENNFVADEENFKLISKLMTDLNPIFKQPQSFAL